MFQAILFDLDDTLYDLRTHRELQLRRTFGAVLGRDATLDLEALVAAGVAEQIFISQMSDFLRRHNVADEALVALAQERYRRHWFDDMALAPEIAAVLDALGRRFKLGLVTNGPAWSQRAKIERLGLAGRMQALIVSEEVGVAKPDPAIFLLALKQLEVGPEDALFVGDSPEADLAGAAAVGMRAVWVNPGDRPVPPGLPPPLAVIRRLPELLPLVGVARGGSESATLP